MKILITGGSGLLGSYLVKILKKDHEVIAPLHKHLDIANYSLLCETIHSYKPDLVIHCAAIAKFAIAEDKPIDTINTNIIGTSNIARLCISYNIRMVYISTSHVFDGIEGNYKSTDKVNPLTKYSKSKVAGEMATLIHENSLVIRTEFCEETFPFETAYVDKFSSKEYIDIIAPKIAEKCLSDRTGICHVGGPRRSFYEFGKIRNPNVKEGSVKNLASQSKVPILIDTSLISD
jgi:dTDP-4-dehydrorhamnose reductase